MVLRKGAVVHAGRGKLHGRTCQPGEHAQTLFPSVLKMAALSTSPVPTRLEVENLLVTRSLYKGKDACLKSYLWST